MPTSQVNNCSRRRRINDVEAAASETQRRRETSSWYPRSRSGQVLLIKARTAPDLGVA